MKACEVLMPLQPPPASLFVSCCAAILFELPALALFCARPKRLPSRRFGSTGALGSGPLPQHDPSARQWSGHTCRGAHLERSPLNGWRVGGSLEVAVSETITQSGPCAVSASVSCCQRSLFRRVRAGRIQSLKIAEELLFTHIPNNFRLRSCFKVRQSFATVVNKLIRELGFGPSSNKFGRGWSAVG